MSYYVFDVISLASGPNGAVQPYGLKTAPLHQHPYLTKQIVKTHCNEVKFNEKCQFTYFRQSSWSLGPTAPFQLYRPSTVPLHPNRYLACQIVKIYYNVVNFDENIISCDLDQQLGHMAQRRRCCCTDYLRHWQLIYLYRLQADCTAVKLNERRPSAQRQSLHELADLSLMIVISH